MPQNGPRPHTWVTGTDPLRHEQYTAWHRARAQAHYRGEEWDFPFPDYVRAWGDQWHNKGRGKTNVQMIRRNPARAWARRNVQVVDRADFHRINALRLRARKAAERKE